MDKWEAETLLTRLADAYDRTMGTGRKSIYLEQFQLWDFDVGRRAVNNLIDSEDRFPTIARFLARCQYFAGLKAGPCEDEHEVPMTPDELQDVAAQMATEAAARLARHNGVADVYSQLLEQGATIYARNATLRARGLPTLPLPKIAALIGALAQRVGAEGGLVDDEGMEEWSV